MPALYHGADRFVGVSRNRDMLGPGAPGSLVGIQSATCGRRVMKSKESVDASRHEADVVVFGIDAGAAGGAR